MNRRRFVVGVAALGAAMPLSAFGQARKVIGYLANQKDPTRGDSYPAFLDALRRLGWTEDRCEIWIRPGGGKEQVFYSLADELVRQRADIIVTTGSASTRAAIKATQKSRTPVVFASSANPVEQGFVASLAQPGGNVTGLAVLVQDLVAQRVGLLKELLPGASRIARFHSKGNITELQPAIRRAYDAEAGKRRISLRHVEVVNATQLNQMFGEVVSGGFQAAIVEAEASFASYRNEIAGWALRHRLPVICADWRYVQSGALAGYSEDFKVLYARAAFLVHRILNGANPADLPVERAKYFKLAINAGTARTLGVPISEAIRLQADEIID